MKLTFQCPNIKFHWNVAKRAHMFIYIMPVAVVSATNSCNRGCIALYRKKLC